MIDFIHSETQFFILCLTTLFTLINPIGIAPLLVVMTERFSKDERVKIAKKGKKKYFKRFNEISPAKYIVDISTGKINNLYN